MVEVEHLVVEGLQCAFGQRDQPHRQVEAGEPGRGLAHMGQVLEVDLNIFALAYSAHRRNQPDRGVRLNHAALLCSFKAEDIILRAIARASGKVT